MKNKSKITKQPKTIQIAYLILVQRFPEQFKRLFKTIYHPDNHYLVHIDQEIAIGEYEEIETFLEEYPNTYLLDSENVLWGGYSMVQVELNGMKFLLDMNLSWDFFINLSGQDFPLQSQEAIQTFLGKNIGKNFITVLDQSEEYPDTLNRVEYHFVENATGFSEVPYQRDCMDGVTSYVGGQWMILTRSCCEFICYSGEVKKFEDFYKHTFIANEGFFQTVLMNTSFNETIVNDDKRAIIWVHDGLIKLCPKTFTEDDTDFLLDSHHFFARKFDEPPATLRLR